MNEHRRTGRFALVHSSSVLASVATLVGVLVITGGILVLVGPDP